MPTLSIPESIHCELAVRAAAQNVTVDDLAARLLAADVAVRPVSERVLDAEYHAECAAEATAVPALAEVRAILARVPGSLSADLIGERDDR